MMGPEQNVDPTGDRDDEVVREEEEAAAREAAAIGGDPHPSDAGPAVDEAARPLAEAGEGEAEGFEEAERELEEHASHGEDGPDPTHLAGEPEPHPSGTEYGDADSAKSSERD